ncbi:MAG: NUDIX hydrolase [Bacteroidia bacterium]|nr:NUDIX hydrolase [Bacteroidia bacterium]
MNYCSHCGSGDIRLEVPEGDNRLRYCCPVCSTIHYQNPNVVVGCLPVFEGKILLCRRAIEPRLGFWNLPAGYLENGETVEEGALRETREEAGIEVSIVRLHALYNLPRVNQVYLFYLAEMPHDQFHGGVESLEVKLFSPADIPYHDMAFASSTFAIRQYLDHLHSDFHGVHVGKWE